MANNPKTNDDQFCSATFSQSTKTNTTRHTTKESGSVGKIEKGMSSTVEVVVGLLTEMVAIAALVDHGR
jgi:hypothetical protein